MDPHRFQVILRTPWRGPWRRFSDPARVIVARAAADVPTALREVDEALRGGSYAAGFVSYEAAAAFGLPVQSPDGDLPLAAFGIFDPDNVESIHRLPCGGEMSVGGWTPSITRDEYQRAVAAVKRAIQAGDTYQINFTFRLDAAFEGDVFALMHSLFVALQLPRWWTSALTSSARPRPSCSSPSTAIGSPADR